MDINQTKELLWNAIKNLSDGEIQEFIFHCQKVASIVVDFSEEDISI